MSLSRCEHDGDFGSREEYCTVHTEELSTWAEIALSSLDRILYNAPWTGGFQGSFSGREQSANQHFSFLEGDELGGWAWPLCTTAINVRHQLVRPSNVETYTVDHTQVVHQWGSVISLPVRYVLARTPGHAVDATVKAYDYDREQADLLALRTENGDVAAGPLRQSRFSTRAMTEYDYGQLIQTLSYAERYLEAVQDDNERANLSAMME